MPARAAPEERIVLVRVLLGVEVLRPHHVRQQAQADPGPHVRHRVRVVHELVAEVADEGEVRVRGQRRLDGFLHGEDLTKHGERVK